MPPPADPAPVPARPPAVDVLRVLAFAAAIALDVLRPRVRHLTRVARPPGDRGRDPVELPIIDDLHSYRPPAAQQRTGPRR